MKMIVARDLFKDAVAWAARGIPPHPHAPILACLRLAVTGSKVTVSGFDYETSAAADVALTTGTDGAILVPGRLLAEITRALPAHPVEITEDGPRAQLTCGPAKFTLLLSPQEDYPTLPELADPIGEIGADAFATAVTQVGPAVGRDDTLPTLTGIRIEFTDKEVVLVATDRYRLATAVIPAAAWTPARRDPAAGPLAVEALVPGKTLYDAVRGLTGDTALSIYLASQSEEESASLVGLAGAGRRLTTRTIAGEYPNYNQLLPTEFAVAAAVPADPLIEAVKRVALVVERNTPIRLTFTAAAGTRTLTLEGGHPTEAQASEVIDTDVTVDGSENYQVAFNPGYLLDALAPLAAGTARFQFTGPTKPAIIDSDDGKTAAGYRTVLVPVKTTE